MILNNSIIETIGWTLIHSFWQITLIGIIVKLFLIIYKNRSSAFKYNIAITGMAAILLATSVTFVKYIPISNHDTTGTSQIITEQPQATSPIVTQNTQWDLNHPMTWSHRMNAWHSKLVFLFNQFTGFAQNNLNIIVGLWVIGAIVFSIRFAGSYWYILRLKQKFSTPLQKKWSETITNISRSLNIKRKVTILESGLTKIPIVIGHLKPAIILPLGLATSLPFNQLEAILTHELAHIKRNDFLVNLICSILETIFFFHPAFWWISKVMNSERENCCDDQTIGYCGTNKHLQKALIDLFEHNQKSHHIAAALYKNKYQLLKRIKRMKTKNLPKGCLRQNNHGNRGSLFSIAVLLSGVIIFASTSAFSPRPDDVPKIPEPSIIIPNVVEVAEGVPEIMKPPLVVPIPEPARVPDSTKKAVAKEEEKALQKNEQELKKVEEELKKIKEKMKEVHSQYDEAFEEYMKLSSEFDNSEYLKSWSLYEDELLHMKELLKLSELENNLAEAYNNISFVEDFEPLQEELLLDLYSDRMDNVEDIIKDIQMEQLFKQEELYRQFEYIEEIRGIGKLEFEAQILETTFREELVKDGIIKSKDDLHSFRLSAKKLFVNGEKQSKELKDKYIKIYEGITDEILSGTMQVIIED